MVHKLEIIAETDEARDWVNTQIAAFGKHYELRGEGAIFARKPHWGAKIEISPGMESQIHQVIAAPHLQTTQINLMYANPQGIEIKLDGVEYTILYAPKKQ